MGDSNLFDVFEWIDMIEMNYCNLMGESDIGWIDEIEGDVFYWIG